MKELRAVWPSILVLAALGPVPARAECVVGTRVHVRETARPDAKVIATIPIAAEVQREEGSEAEGGWTRIVFWRGEGFRTGLEPAGRGWVRAELVGTECPSYELAMESAKAEPAKAASSFERAAALARSRPELIEALDGWARALKRAKDPRAAAIRAQLETVRDPARLRGDADPALAVAVQASEDGTATVYPLAFTGPELVPLLRWESQAEATTFLVRELHAGRTFRMVNGGVITIAADPTFEAFQYQLQRNYSIEAHGRLDVPPGEAPLNGIASSGTLRSAPGRALSASEQQQLRRLADPAFLAQCKGAPDAAAAARAALGSGVASGWAKDLDGDGKEELVGVVEYHAPSDRLVAYVLVVAANTKGEGYTVRHVETHLSEPGGEGKVRFSLMGTADLNGDGKEELVVHTSGHITGSMEILIPVDRGYRRLVVGEWAS